MLELNFNKTQLCLCHEAGVSFILSLSSQCDSDCRVCVIEKDSSLMLLLAPVVFL